MTRRVIKAPENDNQQRKQELIQRAMALRVSGLTYKEISSELGVVSTTSVAKLLDQGLKARQAELSKLGGKLVALEDQRLDKLWAVWYPRALDSEKENVKAVEVCLWIMERRAKMFGSDQPTKSEVKLTYEQMPIEQLIERAKQVGVEIPVELIQGRPPSRKLLPPPPVDTVDAEYEVKNEAGV
jgi:hypothetical protein